MRIPMRLLPLPLVLVLLLPACRPSPDVSALESRLARAEASLVLADQPPSVRSAVRLAAASAMWRPLAVAGVPILGVRITGGGSSSVSDPLVPADGTQNITGSVRASTNVSADNGYVVGADTAFANYYTAPTAGGFTFTGGTATLRQPTAGQRVVLTTPANHGFDLETSGAKTTCNSTNAGSLFYENTDGDSTTATLYMCMESAANTFSWRSVATGG